MRILAVLAIIATALVLDVRPSLADGPWCAIYSSKGSSAKNCGFHSYSQCMASASPGGFCERNPDPEFQPTRQDRLIQGEKRPPR